MKTLKWFSLEWNEVMKTIFVIEAEIGRILIDCETEQQAFDWLEANDYIERI